MRLLLGLTFVLGLLCAPAFAHEGRPVLAKIGFSAESGQASLQWQVPPIVPLNAEPRLYLSGCTERTAPTHGLQGNAAYHCASGLDDVVLHIDWPSINPALSTLVELHGGQTQFFGPEQTSISLNGFEVARTDFTSFIASGITHILSGYDHLLFILALTLVVLIGAHNQPIRRLTLMVTGFTIAHSVTLAAASLDLVRLPAVPVETVIALSILFVAAELARGNQSTLTFRYPALTASTFGLLHGFGFASVLGDAGLPDDARVAALLGFNLGVEIGQLAFVSAILLIAVSAWKIVPDNLKPFGLQAIVAMIGTMSSFWMIERLMQF